MPEQAELARMQALIQQLNQYAYEYYTLDNATVSDAAYDALYDELRALEEETGAVLPDSPTQRVGGAVLAEFKKHTHKARLWSLDKAQNETELAEWENRLKKAVAAHETATGEKLAPLSYLVTLKFDGLTVNLTYAEGILAQAATRGTGETGEAILAQVQTIKTIPRKIQSPAVLEVRGEAFLTKQAFRAYNEKAAIPLKNLRNGAAGALRNLDTKETARRNLSAWFYDIGFYEGIIFKTYEEMLIFLEEQGFPVHPYHPRYDSLEEVAKEITLVDAKRENYDFEIDGLVVAVNDLRTREILGYTVKFPRWAIAYKFAPQDAQTRLLEVEWNVGRTGKVTPTALLEPIDVGGVTIKRATLNNLDDIARKGVRIGAEVLVRRANDVIPEITGVVEDTLPGSREIEAPEECPSCRSRLVRDGVHLFCENTLSCKPQLVKSIVHFAGREAMNIEGFNEKTAFQFFEQLNLREISDLYRLTEAQLLTLEKFKEKKARNLLAAIENSKKIALDAFIYALGIPHVGKKTAQDLARHFKSLEALAQAGEEELLRIPEVGEIVAAGIRTFFADARIRESIDALLAAGVQPEYRNKEILANPFSGKTMVVTGSLNNYTRSEIEQMLSGLGAKVSGSVSKKTDYLLAGAEAGSKLDKAQELLRSGVETNLRILSEREFLDMLKGD
ncbi:MAG: NAD-dependent DNA ligase LigA [Clostridia bacterium]|jgi:DNA ligase (NAD+)|nr:NAD-dependent DNA ligase LigA [Clostridia bacterium]